MPNNKRPNQRIIDRLMLDHAFIKIRENAKSDKTNLKKYVAQARTMYRLSPYWDGIISWLLTYDGLVEKLPITGAMIESKIDPITGKEYYLVPVYPETTDNNIRSSAKLIRKRYVERGEVIDIRKASTKNNLVEFRALELYESGESYESITKILSTEFGGTYIVNEIPTLIQKATDKSLRQEDRS